MFSTYLHAIMSSLRLHSRSLRLLHNVQFHVLRVLCQNVMKRKRIY